MMGLVFLTGMGICCMTLYQWRAVKLSTANEGVMPLRWNTDCLRDAWNLV